jgi:hypothetical protein
MGSHKTDKKSKKDKKSSKEKSSRKYHKHKRHKKRKKHDSSCSSSSSDSDSGYEGAGSALSQLERERAAVQAVRYLLSSQPAIRKSFREVRLEACSPLTGAAGAAREHGCMHSPSSAWSPWRRVQINLNRTVFSNISLQVSSHVVDACDELHHSVHACCCLQLLWELDNGRSVGLSGVPDELLRSQLQYTLELLGLKCTKVQMHPFNIGC